MPSIPRPAGDTEATAQQLLSEQGSYSPIELLLATSNLSYDDYHVWRTGERPTLDDALAAGVEGTRKLVSDADAWARALRLHPAHNRFYGIDAHAGVELTASADADLDALLHTEYRARADRHQTDIFLDTSDQQAVNELVAALSARDVTAAEACIKRLAHLDAEHWMLPSARTLATALATPPPGTRDDALRRIDTLEQQWLPAASAVLRSAARDFVTPMWRSIGAALEDGTPYDPARPKAHASFAYAHGLAWTNVRRTVHDVPNHRTAPPLLEILAEAEWRLRHRREAVALWFALCWLAPAHFADAVRATGFPDAAVRESWARLQDQDWASPVTAAWFPAWMVLDEPGVGRSFKPTEGTSAPEQAFDLLLRLRAGGSDREDIDNRRALQELHPGLFDGYLASLDA